MIERLARVRFLTAEEGGRETAPLSGVRSQLEIFDVMTSCTLSRTDDEPLIPLGAEVNVSITLSFPEEFDEAFLALRVARLFEGSKLVAEGQFLD